MFLVNEINNKSNQSLKTKKMKIFYSNIQLVSEMNEGLTDG